MCSAIHPYLRREIKWLDFPPIVKVGGKRFRQRYIESTSIGPGQWIGNFPQCISSQVYPHIKAACSKRLGSVRGVALIFLICIDVTDMFVIHKAFYYIVIVENESMKKVISALLEQEKINLYKKEIFLFPQIMPQTTNSSN
ncbi:hypothetical protein TNCT_122261 [Trichonephila clavata]|uniref:Uncharacterized protein n=1 Tax=Trichonephila clavata TaxID=2740835 RepID=A0A8X6HNL6_TRICU|nr:hypothetical protein TNCT_122261 [Trichonephila clavata]